MNTKVLIVDDEPDVRFIVKSLLKSRGVEVEGSATIKECITKVGTYQPDAIVLDIDLPDGSGLEAIPRIKSQKPDVRIVINSAMDTAENRNRADELGTEVFLSKPLRKDQLFEALNV